MAVHNLGTKALQAAGIPLEVHSGATGYRLCDPRFKAQIGTVYKTAFEAVNEAVLGARPKEIRTEQQQPPARPNPPTASTTSNMWHKPNERRTLSAPI